MALTPIVGLHHVTAIASDPQRNLDFYTRVLGQRFVKKTVNFDDPGTYHTYFGDDLGSPGTIITFFPWPGATRGVAGVGETIRTAYSVPVGSLEYWAERLAGFGVVTERVRRFGEEALQFADPDGMGFELVGDAHAPEVTASRFADVPAEHAIRGFFGVTLLEASAEKPASVLGVMGFRETAREGDRVRFRAAGEARGNHIDVVVDAKAGRGRTGAGTVHHIAFRTTDAEAQVEWQKALEAVVQVTPVQDRDYFTSIYYREPGGVLFELATDPPGFTLDEPLETLGEELRIPAWLEPRRAMIEQRLVPLVLHKARA